MKNNKKTKTELNDNSNYNEQFVKLANQQIKLQEKQNKYNLIIGIGILITAFYYISIMAQNLDSNNLSFYVVIVIFAFLILRLLYPEVVEIFSKKK